MDIATNFNYIDIVALYILNSSPPRITAYYSSLLSGLLAAGIERIKHLTTCLDTLTHVNSTVVLLGDFNLTSISWSIITKLLLPSNPYDEFLNFISRNALEQLVTIRTRPNQHYPLLSSRPDLLITNN